MIDTLKSNELILKLINLIGLNDYIDKIFEILTPLKFYTLSVYALVFFLLIIKLFYFILKNNKKLLLDIKNFNSKFLIYFKKLIKLKIIYLLIIPVFTSLFLITNLPITYDEAFTYLNFIDRGILVSSTYYPAPNNHVLYSIISSLLNHFVSLHSILPYRFISLIFYILSIFVFIKIIQLKDNIFNPSFFFVIGTAPLTYVAIYQSALARGYSTLLFLTLLNVLFALKIHKKSFNKNLWIYFSVSSSFAFFVNPSYLYSHFLICLLLLFYNKDKLKLLLKYNFIIFIFCTFLYFPILIFQDFNLISKTGSIGTINSFNYIDYFRTAEKILIYDTLNLSRTFFYGIILFGFFGSIISKSLKEYSIILAIIVLQVTLPFFHNMIGVSRIFILNYFLFFYLISISLRFLLLKININFSFFLVLILQLILVYSSVKKFKNFEKWSFESEKYIRKIISNNSSYISCSNLFDPFLGFYIKKYNIINSKIIFVKQKMCDTDDFKNLDYTWLIIDKNRDLSSKNKINFSYELWNFYNKKN